MNGVRDVLYLLPPSLDSLNYQHKARFLVHTHTHASACLRWRHNLHFATRLHITNQNTLLCWFTCKKCLFLENSLANVCMASIWLVALGPFSVSWKKVGFHSLLNSDIFCRKCCAYLWHSPSSDSLHKVLHITASPLTSLTFVHRGQRPCREPQPPKFWILHRVEIHATTFSTKDPLRPTF